MSSSPNRSSTSSLSMRMVAAPKMAPQMLASPPITAMTTSHHRGQKVEWLRAHEPQVMDEQTACQRSIDGAQHEYLHLELAVSMPIDCAAASLPWMALSALPVRDLTMFCEMSSTARHRPQTRKYLLNGVSKSKPPMDR